MNVHVCDLCLLHVQPFRVCCVMPCMLMHTDKTSGKGTGTKGLHTLTPLQLQ